MLNAKFRKVLEPGKIGKLELRNRIVMAPMVTNYCDHDGHVTERFKAYHEARAKGGVGLIIIEATYVTPSGRGFPNEVGISDDSHIKGLKELTDAVHKHGAKIATQLYHGGRQTHAAVAGRTPVAPSSIACPVCQEVPDELTTEEVKEIVEAFAEGAKRAKEAGFDAVELHGAHGYLLNQFLSPYSNKRTDQYGGSFENRMRMPLEVLKEVRKKVGKDFPIIYRLTSEEFVAGGLTIEETKQFSKVLVENGIDAINVSGGVYESAAMIIQPAAVPQGLFVENAFAIRKAIGAKVPVMVVGRIKDPEMAETILEQEKADFITMGRGLLADPEYVNKLSRNDLDGIRRCIACNQGCIDRLFMNLDIGCLVNATVGNELDYSTDKAAIKKKVVVIGSGPAGLEAARVAALRGHDVTIFEKEDKIGGQLNIAAVPPHKEEVADLIKFLTEAIRRLKVRVVLNKEADVETIKAEKADAVIVATGSAPVTPNIAGIDRKEVVNAHDVLKGKASTGQNVVVVGGGSVGCETAEYLVTKGKNVTIIEMLDDVMQDSGVAVKALMLMRLAAENVSIMRKSKVIQIKDNCVLVQTENGNQCVINMDTVVIAVGARSVNTLSDKLKGARIPHTVIGDCIKPRKIYEAIQEAYRAAYDV
ncbi:MAG: FAD-dependent oxidoreductase [Clostridiaceae bacterium]|nr:FAD-dependent oxidoreductase [Clostridiaceae bacterium]